MTATLAVRDLKVGVRTRRGLFAAVDGVSFEVGPGETVGVVGESGSGKTVSMLAILGLLPRPPEWVVEGRAELNGRDLLRLPPAELRRIRGRDVSMIFQNPRTSLNPVFPIGDQIAEAIRVHAGDVARHDAERRARELLEAVGIPDASRRMRQYAHELSGGMAQRVMIAMALANSPSLLIADEPTTALDVTIQAQVMEVLRQAMRDFGSSLVLITHNLGLVAEMADRVVVMYAGRAMETAAVDDVFHQPRHPYTIGLMRSVPAARGPRERLIQIPGQPPTPADRPAGCPFHPRCTLSAGREQCRVHVPDPVEAGAPGHLSACHFWPEAAP